MNGKRKEILIVVAIITIAAFFRFHDLAALPPGLYPDEAMNGNDAVTAIDDGHFQVFYPNNNGREGLFINIQGLFVKALGHKAWVLRIVSAILGTLTVWGLYLLAKELFDRNVAYFSSFLFAILLWHVNFSRIGFRAIMLPLILVFEFYFLWKAFKFGHLSDFIATGVVAGLGAYTYISYRVSPLIVILTFLNYWLYIKKDFSGSKYEHSRNQMFKGFVVMVSMALLVALPMVAFLIMHPDQFFSRAGSYLSVFGQDHPLRELVKSISQTLAMFSFRGDFNWRHNISGSPQLFWPIGALFTVGFIKEMIHWLKKKHGHFSPTHTLLFAWFFVMLLPGFLSIEAPHALRTIGVIPVVMIFAGKGLWWFYEKLHHGLIIYDPDKRHQHQKHLMLNVTLAIFLLSLSVTEFWRYHVIWGQSVQGAFNQEYANIATYLNNLPDDVPKYVIVNVEGVYVNIPGDPSGRSMPVPAQTVMFLTDTFTYQKQMQRNIFYITEKEFQNSKISSHAVVVYLESKND